MHKWGCSPWADKLLMQLCSFTVLDHLCGTTHCAPWLSVLRWASIWPNFNTRWVVFRFIVTPHRSPKVCLRQLEQTTTRCSIPQTTICWRSCSKLFVHIAWRLPVSSYRTQTEPILFVYFMASHVQTPSGGQNQRGTASGSEMSNCKLPVCVQMETTKLF